MIKAIMVIIAIAISCTATWFATKAHYKRKMEEESRERYLQEMIDRLYKQISSIEQRTEKIEYKLRGEWVNPE